MTVIVCRQTAGKSCINEAVQYSSAMPTAAANAVWFIVRSIDQKENVAMLNTLNPLNLQRFKAGSLVYGLVIGVLFAVVFFNPFTRANIAFAIRTDPDMSHINAADQSGIALLYFAVVGLGLGGVRLTIWQRIKGAFSLPAMLGVMVVGSTASIYLALRLLNPALACMLEDCHSTFVLNYGLATLGMSSILAYNVKFLPDDQPPQNQPQPQRPQAGCS